MNSKKLENWVKEKLDNGIEPDRIKSSLDNKGYDPEIVDEVLGERKHQNGTKSSEESASPDLANEKNDSGPDKDFKEEWDQKLSEVEVEKDDGYKTPEVQNNGNRSKKNNSKNKSFRIPSIGDKALKIGKTGFLVVLAVSIVGAGTVYGPLSLPEEPPNFDTPEIPTPSVQPPSIEVPSVKLPSFSSNSSDTDKKKDQKEVEKTTGQVSLPDRKPPEIQGETVEVVLTDRLAKPSRASIGSTDGVKFVNNASYDFNVTFDSSVQSFVLPVGKSWTVAPNSITYYSAEAVSSDQTVQGSVYVQ